MKFPFAVFVFLVSALAGFSAEPVAAAATTTSDKISFDKSNAPAASTTATDVADTQAKEPIVAEDASAPVEKKDGGKFIGRHEAFLKRGQEGPIGLLFLGDSITANWTRAKPLWEERYAKFKAANFGIGGDRTQHVIWRIEHGELDGIHPGVVVFMLGTNNTASNTADEIAAADEKIIRMIRAKIPETKVLLLGVFPRGPRKNKAGIVTDTGVKRMEVIHAVNARLAKLDDGRNVRFLDIGAKFFGTDGKISDDIMPDQLHPSAAGYQIWADAMQPLLDDLMK
jgi:lysophospholipase L1-like esterase